MHLPIQEEDGEESIITSLYPDEFEMRWNVPADNGEPIDYYQIHYCPVSGLQFETKKPFPYLNRLLTGRQDQWILERGGKSLHNSRQHFVLNLHA